VSQSLPVGFRRPWSFWLGATAVTAGVLLHLPMFVGARGDHYVLRGMPFDPWMIVGMGLILGGYLAVLYGLAPRFQREAAVAPDSVEFRALDSTRLRPAHLKLMLVLLFA